MQLVQRVLVQWWFIVHQAILPLLVRQLRNPIHQQITRIVIRKQQVEHRWMNPPQPLNRFLTAQQIL